MKILRHTGQKVLDAPIELGRSYKISSSPEPYIIELYTVDRNTLYFLTLQEADIEPLQAILKRFSDRQ